MEFPTVACAEAGESEPDDLTLGRSPVEAEWLHEPFRLRRAFIHPPDGNVGDGGGLQPRSAGHVDFRLFGAERWTLWRGFLSQMSRIE